jgi:Ca2+-binding RTX toxin-like protein
MKRITRTTALAALAGAAMIPLAMAVPADAATHKAAPSFVPTSGYNLVFGTSHNDTLFGTHGDDAILGFKGNDRLISRGGNDLMYGGRGDDTLVDNAPSFFGFSVVMRGGSGNDVCIGNDADTFLNCETVIVL